MKCAARPFEKAELSKSSFIIILPKGFPFAICLPPLYMDFKKSLRSTSFCFSFLGEVHAIFIIISKELSSMSDSDHPAFTNSLHRFKYISSASSGVTFLRLGLDYFQSPLLLLGCRPMCSLPSQMVSHQEFVQLSICYP